MYNIMSPQQIADLKNKLRREVSKKRNAISVPDQIFYSRMIFEKIRAQRYYLRANNILLYSNFGSEVRTDEFLQSCLADGKKVYYPKTNSSDNSMDFYQITSLVDLNTGNYGIREPYGFERVYTKKDVTGVSDTLMIVPGLVFSNYGYRIGYGKGYYDRYLQRFPEIFKCGVAYELQMQEAIPFDSFDEVMDSIVTEGRLWIRDGIGGVRWN